MPPTTLTLIAAVFGLISALAAPVFAAGTDDGTAAASTTASAYEEAKALVDADNFVAALPALLAITAEDAGNADAWNLLGYTHRNLGQMEESSAAYLKVLTINPDHLGALEYQGELFLQTGKPDLAKANLEKLKGLCGTCEEAEDLEKAISAAGA
jgi:tetratricopeptide (TPR) repeat protein